MTKIAVWSAAALALLLVAYVAFLHLLIDPILSRMESRRMLSNASTPKQLREATGHLGAFFTFPDGSWLAIRYRDSHAGGIWSMAVARDSGGGWYESREHFCGALSAVQLEQTLLKVMGEVSAPTTVPLSPPDPASARVEWIHSLAESPDLPTARRQLTSRYFHETR